MTHAPAELIAEIRTLISSEPTEAGRADLIYDITRACYDAVKSVEGGDADTAERAGVGRISDAALAHQSAAHGWDK